MHSLQAIVVTCIDDRIRKPMENFLENELNLYAVGIKTDLGGVKKLFEEGPIREWIFENLAEVFKVNNVNRVILINHQDCTAYGGSEAFKTPEEEINAHEIQLRHAVSGIHAKFPDKQVEAYLALLNYGKVTFKKVI